mmetsp:Transcript_272/g.701  ORF Transcript_272/g.701 Transcript_272/m.701 type:complete len:95 (+) Transcript_272:286-570(+)
MEFIDLTDGDSQPRAKIAQTDEAISRTLERYTEEANTAGEDDELRITGESGIDTPSLPHHRYLCRKHPFDKAAAAAADGFSNAPACDNCWRAVT